MAAARLTDSQRQELVRRFRQGESTQDLADHYGCSTTTVTRVARADIPAKEYAALLEQRQKKGPRDQQIPLAIAEPAPASAADDQEEPHPMVSPVADPEPAAAALSRDLPAAPALPDQMDRDASPAQEDDEPLHSPGGQATGLAIDDADDFSADEDAEEDLLSSDDDGSDDDEASAAMEDFHTVAVLPIAVDDQRETLPAPWSPSLLPACAYLLVDKTVELQARPLAEMPELGRLPSEEQQRQALVLFTNPRQAKRQCGRSQRVIKLPDPSLLGRTAPYLLAQGISRVVIEGSLYALPEA